MPAFFRLALTTLAVKSLLPNFPHAPLEPILFVSKTRYNWRFLNPGTSILSIKKILVANRSEIAIRVFRAANELDIKTVAIWAEEDKLALHRFKADEAYQVGKGPHLAEAMGPIESYLSIEEVLRVAKLSGADAIHPGYGLLSESPEFVDACDAAGILFIGPSAQTMRSLGNKVAARNLALSLIHI